jgi:hypothetical protein
MYSNSDFKTGFPFIFIKTGSLAKVAVIPKNKSAIENETDLIRII